MVITILLRHENLSGLDINVPVQHRSLLQDTGHVKNCGQEREVPHKVHQKVDKENIKLTCSLTCFLASAI